MQLATISAEASEIKISCNSKLVTFYFGEHAQTCSVMHMRKSLNAVMEAVNESNVREFKKTALLFLRANSGIELTEMSKESKRIASNLGNNPGIRWIGIEEEERRCAKLGCGLESTLRRMDAAYRILVSKGEGHVKIPGTNAEKVLLLYFGSAEFAIWKDQGKFAARRIELIPMDLNDPSGDAGIASEFGCFQGTKRIFSTSDSEGDDHPDEKMRERNRFLIRKIGEASRVGPGLVTFGEYHEEILLGKKAEYQNDFRNSCKTAPMPVDH